jgi:DNA-binding transcriptional MocR family regulator
VTRKKEPREQFTPLLHHTTDSAAWLALSAAAKALYPHLKRRAGFNGNHNGDVFLGVRDAAKYLRVKKDTAARAFLELQAKGFLVAIRVGCLGVAGEGRATTWRLTELGTPADRRPSKEFLRWQPGHDFAVQKGRSVRPKKAPRPNGSDVVTEFPRRPR